MNKDKDRLKHEITKTRADAKACAQCGNFYLANELEKRVTAMVRKCEAL